MNKRAKARSLGIKVGRLPTGEKNCITDVADVRVGHVTIDSPIKPNAQLEGDSNEEAQEEYACTGVTAILPHGGSLFREKVVAASYVLNGFGKTTGLVQVDELGQIESPIMLTNTLSVPAVTHGALQHMLQENPEIGDTTSTINMVTAECNDGYLNSIRNLYVTPEHALEAIRQASTDQVPEGAVGAGKGMVCFGYKGGIGSSSRIIKDDSSDSDSTYTLGSLVLSNFGKREEFQLERYLSKVEQLEGQRTIRVDQEKVQANTRGVTVETKEATMEATTADLGKEVPDGSIIIVLATDAPLSDRQLKRVAKRCGIGLGRTGSHFSHGSGDIVVAFSTANKISHFNEQELEQKKYIRENHPLMNLLFTAAAEATEEAIVNSLTQAQTTSGRKQRVVEALNFDIGRR
ncbi:P1 family peptidase [Bacillus horti]|uniref:D-aminopeptidase n=1 Tax=Caldalkalibacillus horti TaxID=77523 RepID=A0ABT9VZ44_9BACI|nr:P1 family peptidase [Bacillus horti]MDQ0166261.1 D-aminopeptidase [Bacillus horti]